MDDAVAAVTETMCTERSVITRVILGTNFLDTPPWSAYNLGQGGQSGTVPFRHAMVLFSQRESLVFIDFFLIFLQS